MRRFLIAAAAAITALGSTAAKAEIDVDISIGIPGVIYERPHYHRHPPRVVVVPSYRDRPVVVYSDRYYYDKHPKRHKHWKHKHWKEENWKRERSRHWRDRD